MNRTFYAVVRPNTDELPIYPTREHAEAIANAKRYEYPTLGPWEVVELVEVQPQKVAA